VNTKRHRARVWLVTIPFLSTGAAIAVIVYLCFLKPNLEVYDTCISQMPELVHRIRGFIEQTHRTPSNLAEVVATGFLPERSSLYFNPMKHRSRAYTEISFSNCEFGVAIDSNTVTVYIRPEDYDRRHYGRFIAPDEPWYLTATVSVADCSLAPRVSSRHLGSDCASDQIMRLKEP
jgi:hypothetical protein